MLDWALTGKPPDPHRLGDVLQRLEPEGVARDIDLAADLPIGVIGDADPAGLCNALESRGNIDAIAEDVVVIDDDVADMDADADFDAAVRPDIRVLSRHAVLDFDRAARSIHGAGKLHQQAVAG